MEAKAQILNVADVIVPEDDPASRWVIEESFETGSHYYQYILSKLNSDGTHDPASRKKRVDVFPEMVFGRIVHNHCTGDITFKGFRCEIVGKMKRILSFV